MALIIVIILIISYLIILYLIILYLINLYFIKIVSIFYSIIQFIHQQYVLFMILDPLNQYNSDYLYYQLTFFQFYISINFLIYYL